MSDDKNTEPKKKGFFAKAFGLKSKEEKRAEAAALKAQQQAQVDAQMAERMAVINAAALKAAREQDEKNLSAAEKERLEQEERKQAEAQAKEDALAAKRLVAEQAKAEAERLAAIEAEKRAKIEKQAAEKAQQERAQAEKERVVAEKAALEKASAVQAAALKVQQEKERTLRLVAEKKRAEAEAAQKAKEAQAETARFEAENLEAEKLAKEKADTEQADLKLEAEKQAVLEATPEAEAAKPSPAPEPTTDKPGFLQRITTGLKKSTSQMSENMSTMFNKRKLDAQALEELEDFLIASDLGVGTAARTTALLAKDKFDKQITDLEIKIALADVISETLVPLEKPLELSGAKPEILLFVGVNGSGKTTTLGKIAKRFTDDGKKVLLAAGDTFRAAATEQLKVWGERAGAPVVSAPLGADAAGLVYDAIERARLENFDVLMIDTAGRLQNRTELMDELAKIVRVIKKQDESAPHHSILVLDATVGQNALSQTESFAKTAGITGLIMTKLDGTAKGGVLVALSDKFKLPIHAIGIGERIEDLENFSAPVFAAALSGIADAVVEGSASRAQ